MNFTSKYLKIVPKSLTYKKLIEDNWDSKIKNDFGINKYVAFNSKALFIIVRFQLIDINSTYEVIFINTLNLMM